MGFSCHFKHLALRMVNDWSSSRLRVFIISQINDSQHQNIATLYKNSSSLLFSLPAFNIFRSRPSSSSSLIIKKPFKALLTSHPRSTPRLFWYDMYKTFSSQPTESDKSWLGSPPHSFLHRRTHNEPSIDQDALTILLHPRRVVEA